MIDVSSILNYQLFHADCFEKLQDISDNSIDLICCDHPYNLADYSTGNMSFSWRADVNNKLAEWDEKPFNPFDLVQPFKRIIKPSGNIFIFAIFN